MAFHWCVYLQVDQLVDAELRYYIENQSFYEKHELDFRECRDPMDLLRTCASHPKRSRR